MANSVAELYGKVGENLVKNFLWLLDGVEVVGDAIYCESDVFVRYKGVDINVQAKASTVKPPKKKWNCEHYVFNTACTVPNNGTRAYSVGDEIDMFAIVGLNDGLVWFWPFSEYLKNPVQTLSIKREKLRPLAEGSSAKAFEHVRTEKLLSQCQRPATISAPNGGIDEDDNRIPGLV